MNGFEMRLTYWLQSTAIFLVLLGGLSSAKGDGKRIADDILSKKDLFLKEEDPKHLAKMQEFRQFAEELAKKKQQMLRIREDSRQRALKREAIRQEMSEKNASETSKRSSRRRTDL